VRIFALAQQQQQQQQQHLPELKDNDDNCKKYRLPYAKDFLSWTLICSSSLPLQLPPANNFISSEASSHATRIAFAKYFLRHSNNL